MYLTHYTLIVGGHDDPVVVRSGNSLARLTTMLYATLLPELPGATGKIIDNYTGKTVRSCQQAPFEKMARSA